MAASLSKRNSARALASSVLPTPVGPRNRNEPIGRFGSCSPARLRRTASATALDGGVLIDHPQVDLVLQLQELVALGREHLGDGDARPLADDLGDLLGVDLLLEQPLGVAALGLGRRRRPRPAAIFASRSLRSASSRASSWKRASSGRSPRCCMWRISVQARSYSTCTAARRSRTFWTSPRPDFSNSHWPRRSWSSFSSWAISASTSARRSRACASSSAASIRLASCSCSSRRWTTSISVRDRLELHGEPAGTPRRPGRSPCRGGSGR